MKLVSIIIPTLGREEGLKRCLDSIKELNYPDIETVVIKDEPRQGLPKRTNEGFAKSKGEFIVFASDDVEFTSDSVKLAVEVAEEYDLVAFNTGDVSFVEGNHNEQFLIRRDFVNKFLNGRIFDEDFNHLGVDNLLWAQVKKYGKAKRLDTAVLKHYHWTKGAPMDETYKKGWSKVQEDREVLKRKLDELEGKYVNNIEGMISQKELEWLLAVSQGMDNVCEVGSWMGRSTHALLMGCKGIVHAVDHFKGSADPIETGYRDVYDDFIKNVGHFKNLKIHRTTSTEASKEFDDNSLDMVFIDEGHQYHEVVEDIVNWLPKAKKVLCGHDYDAPQVAKAIKDTLGKVDVYERIWFLKLEEPLHQLKTKIAKGENFSFVKMGDGEIMAMRGDSGQNCDGQRFSPELQESLKNGYRKIGQVKNAAITKWKLGLDEDRKKLEQELGIKCVADHDLLLNRSLSIYQYNFWKAIKDSPRRKIFVGPMKLKDVINFLNIDRFVEIPVVNAFSFKPKIDVKENDIILFSAGLASKVWIGEIISENLTCIDCGSAFDPLFVGITRTHQVARDVLSKFYEDLTAFSSNQKIRAMFDAPQETHPERLFAVKELGESKEVLDIGCGRHKTVPYAKGVDIISGVDIRASGDDLPIKDESVDAIISRHSFEHLLDSVKTLKEWLRVLKKGGKIIMILPDYGRLDTMNLCLSGGVHLHAFTRESLFNLLSLFDVKVKVGTCVENWSFYAIVEK